MQLEKDPLVVVALEMFDGRLLTETQVSRYTSGEESSSPGPSRPSSPSAGRMEEPVGEVAMDTSILDEFINMRPCSRTTTQSR